MSRPLVSKLSAVFVGLSFCANAAPLGFSHNLSSQSARTRLAEGAAVLAPFQHVRFCVKNPSECAADASGAEEVELDDATIRSLIHINAEVNASIEPMRKTVGYTSSSGWRIAPSQGDCNDYAVTKRHRLIEAGLPSRSLVLAVVKTAGGEGHLVLVVKTTGGDFVLDNLDAGIRPWFETHYEWVSRQSSANPRFWVQATRSHAPAPVQLARSQDRPSGERPSRDSSSQERRLPFFVFWAGAGV
jgi:predicted transglutaminase-like cysteine proteinase